jgi:hypothetical protein
MLDWLKTAERFRAMTRGKAARPEDDDDDDDDLPGPTASAVVGWLPFFHPKGSTQLQPA